PVGLGAPAMDPLSQLRMMMGQMGQMGGPGPMDMGSLRQIIRMLDRQIVQQLLGGGMSNPPGDIGSNPLAAFAQNPMGPGGAMPLQLGGTMGNDPFAVGGALPPLPGDPFAAMNPLAGGLAGGFPGGLPTGLPAGLPGGIPQGIPTGFGTTSMSPCFPGPQLA